MIGRMGTEALQRQKRQPENRPKEQQLDVRKFRRVELTQAKLPVVLLYDCLWDSRFHFFSARAMAAMSPTPSSTMLGR